jgi:Pyruvate/2-oxoacid:ferredoxin oxidoreductase gamma subunit
MTANESSRIDNTWFDGNQQYLVAALAEVRVMLEQFFARSRGENSPAGDLQPATRKREEALATLAPPPTLEVLTTVFALSPFERKLLLMCAGAEFDSRFAALFSGRNSPRTQPVFSLALAAFDDAHWSALAPSRPLRRWHLIDILPGDALTTSPLRIDERVLHYLAGVPCIDERLRAALTVAPSGLHVAPSYQETGRHIASTWAQSKSQLPIVQICGDDVAAKRSVASAAASTAGLGLLILDPRNLRTNVAELAAFVRLVEREAVLGSSALLVESDDAEAALGLPEGAVISLVESVRSPLMLAARSPRRMLNRSTVVFEVGKPKASEQAEIWRHVLAGSCSGLNGELSTLVSQFSLTPGRIHSAAEEVLRQPPESNRALQDKLWDVCRVQSRPRLDGLAQRIEPAAAWEDLVLPERQAGILREVAIHVRQRAKVYHEWGFASKGLRGLGISALFAGPSGTGKTMAGEVLAQELRLDLYRIDLSQVVSKYIGETEKNLRRVFDAAEEGASILLFDEADALFGKRSEVKDSHDRYANIEVSYLLQRMESYRGLAILTTNRKSALDPAFMRRLRFVVEFPFPDAAQRAEIWRRIFPAQTPTRDLRIDRLARLNAAGGNIRNIAMWAAFLAANAGEPVSMSHLLSAARSEFAKIEKPLADTELAGWV